MALAKKCDICGDLYPYDSKVKINAIALGNLDQRACWSSYNVTYDCCPRCLTAITICIENLKIRKEN